MIIMPNQRINPDQMPKETWEAVKRGLGIEIDKGKIEREVNAAQRVRAREEKNPEYKILRTLSRGASLFDALRIAENEGKTMLSHPQFQSITEDPELYEKYRSALPAWSSTGIAYAAPGEEFGKMIRFEGLAVEIPNEYQNLKDAALIFPNLRIEQDSKGLYHINTAEVDVVEKFPPTEKWCLPDPKYAIPQGSESSESDPSALYLWRLHRPYVGAVVAGWDIQYLRGVDAECPPHYGVVGVVVANTSATSHQR